MPNIAEWLEGKTVRNGPGDSLEVSDGEDFLRYVPRADDNPYYQDIIAAGLVPAVPSIDLVAYAADQRWRKEVGGITVVGVPIATDDRAKMMILGARLAASADPEWSTVWHGSDGGSYPVDAAAMLAISDEVQAHVNATFATFAAVKVAIDTGAMTSVSDIDAAFSGG